IIRLPKGVFAPYTTIKTNLLFFTKGSTVEDGTEHFHTDTIWFYEHPYPTGYKSYSKTKPIRLEEFEPERDWWGSEENDFADREENEFAWKVDFKTKREQADAAAQPHWQRAEELNNQAAVLETEAGDLR
ncbi:N-6 DNA methylase, partial [Enterobacter hormaechei]|uniref:N-6 DNA methylase n=1 Tax=Enterobacter hormaechei TaxID=158836 RepID=UPI0013DF5B83